MKSNTCFELHIFVLFLKSDILESPVNPITSVTLTLPSLYCPDVQGLFLVSKDGNTLI